MPADPLVAFGTAQSDLPDRTRNPLRIALVTETFAPEVNGVAMTLGRLVGGMHRRGHRIQLVRPRLPDDYPHGCPMPVPVPSLQRPGFPIPNYPLMRMGVPSTMQLRASWRASPPDVVHVATEGPMGVSALRAARSLGIPCTSSFHTNFDSYTDHYRFTGLLRGAVATWLRRVHNLTACTMVPTLHQARTLQAEGYRRVRVLSRGLDRDLFHAERRCPVLRRSWGAGPQTLVLSVVGRVAAEKNLPLALRAFHEIRRVVPDSLLVLVGDGPERRRFEGLDGVRLAGTRCGPDLARHYASSDLFLFPSSTETYGNVLVEAMACGLPSVAFDSAAAAELVRSGCNGETVALGDDAGFVAAALRLAGDAELRRRQGAAAIAAVAGRSWRNVVAAFERHLGTAAARGRPRP